MRERSASSQQACRAVPRGRRGATPAHLCLRSGIIRRGNASMVDLVAHCRWGRGVARSPALTATVGVFRLRATPRPSGTSLGGGEPELRRCSKRGTYEGRDCAGGRRKANAARKLRRFYLATPVQTTCDIKRECHPDRVRNLQAALPHPCRSHIHRASGGGILRPSAICGWADAHKSDPFPIRSRLRAR